MVDTPIAQWVIDTRNLWPQAALTSQLSEHAQDALSALSSTERTEVLKYFRVEDAKMALCSRLIKRYAIAHHVGVAWDAATATRNKDTKPIYRAPDGSEPLIFNVSHQAGLVVLVASLNPPPGSALGVDIVCPTERRQRDHDMIRAEGWAAFVDMHAEVLSPAEARALRDLPGSDVDACLRRFYALWCLREAYVKMTGEALLAPWLADLEMRSFEIPLPGKPPRSVRPEVWFRGQRVKDEDVDVRLVDFRDEFMICTAAKRGSDAVALAIRDDYTVLDVCDVVSFAERSRS